MTVLLGKKISPESGKQLPHSVEPQIQSMAQSATYIAHEGNIYRDYILITLQNRKLGQHTVAYMWQERKHNNFHMRWLCITCREKIRHGVIFQRTGWSSFV